MATRRKATKAPSVELPIQAFASKAAFARWLERHHASSPGIWLELAKKSSKRKSISYAEAVEVALCYGWIDGQSRGKDETSWLQKLTPRRARSIWSKLNRERALALIRSGDMRAPGLLAIERAKQDGRWQAAYDPPSRAKVPPDLEAALARNTRAREHFAALAAASRYAVLFRIQNLKRPETRARRIAELVQKLARGESP